MDKVKPITAVKAKPNESLVSLLEDMLSQAKKGELMALVLAGETIFGKVLTGHAIDHDKTNIFQLVGAMDWKKKQIMDAFIQDETFETTVID
jgi:hypothetical protein